MTPEMFKGALKSRTVWWNVLLAFLASIEMFAGNLTILFGQNVAASIMLVGAMANLVLRTITTQALADKK
jgi:hypothetical protein